MPVISPVARVVNQPKLFFHHARRLVSLLARSRRYSRFHTLSHDVLIGKGDIRTRVLLGCPRAAWFGLALLSQRSLEQKWLRPLLLLCDVESPNRHFDETTSWRQSRCTYLVRAAYIHPLSCVPPSFLHAHAHFVTACWYVPCEEATRSRVCSSQRYWIDRLYSFVCLCEDQKQRQEFGGRWCDRVIDLSIDGSSLLCCCS